MFIYKVYVVKCFTQGTHTTSEREKHEHVNEEELDDIDHHSAQRDLQGSQVRVNAEDVHQLES